MRLIRAGAIVAALAVFVLLNPLALARLGYVCATGGCGVRPLWLAVAAVGAGAALWLLRRRAAPAAKAAAPPGARRPKRPAKPPPATAKPRRTATPRPRRTP